MVLTDLSPIASMLVKIVHKNIYPKARYPVETYYQVLVVVFCILNTLQVNWSAFAMHNMSRCLNNTGRTLHFLRFITFLLEEEKNDAFATIQGM